MIFLLFLHFRECCDFLCVYLFIVSSLKWTNWQTKRTYIGLYKNRKKKRRGERKKILRNISPASKKDNLMTFSSFRSYFSLGLIYYRNHYSWLTLFSRGVHIRDTYHRIRCGNQNLIKSNKIFVASEIFLHIWTVFRDAPSTPFHSNSYSLTHTHTHSKN